MNQKNTKGFTLIELLAVIVILAIIALIAVPVIMNIISKANESAFKDSAYGIISAGELYFAERQLEPNGMLEDVTFNLPDTTKTLQLKGEVPTGSILITKEGKVAIAVHNNRYCVTKGIEDKDVKVTEDVENCKIPSVEEEPEENTPQAGSIKTLATISTEVTSVPACINDGTECAPGTPVAIKVNETDVYNFYVISETDNEITLIMDRNIYASGNTTEPDVAWYADSETNSQGPRTAVAALKERTSGWSNIPERKYTYSDDGGGNKYAAFTETMRTRLLTYEEAMSEEIGCTTSNGSCPSWMYINLWGTDDNNTFGYWLSAAYAGSSSGANGVYCDGFINNNIDVYNATQYGLRPVITLFK